MSQEKDPPEGSPPSDPSAPPPSEPEGEKEAGAANEKSGLSGSGTAELASLTNWRAIAGAIISAVGVLIFAVSLGSACSSLGVNYAKQVGEFLPDPHIAWFFVGAHAVISVAAAFFGYQMVKVGERLSQPLYSPIKEEVSTPVETALSTLITFARGLWGGGKE